MVTIAMIVIGLGSGIFAFVWATRHRLPKPAFFGITVSARTPLDALV